MSHHIVMYTGNKNDCIPYMYSENMFLMMYIYGLWYDLYSTSHSDEEFAIPELPSGQELIIHILSTWGDHHYVGLNGLDVFTSTGEQALIEKVSHIFLPVIILPWATIYYYYY